MPDETLRKPGEGASQDEGEKKVAVPPVKVEQKDDSSKKIEELELQRAKDKAEANAKIANLEFENGFKDIAGEYPNALEYKDKIAEKVRAGMSIKDATITTLHPEGKLVTRQEIDSQAAGDHSLGGSSDIYIPRGSKRQEDMTEEEMRAEFIKQEGLGNIKLIDN